MSERSWWLRVSGVDIPIRAGVYVIGRSTACEVVLHSPNVSRRHARLVVTEHALTLEDLGSQNGVFVLGRALPPGPQPLEAGTGFALGGVELAMVTAEPRRSLRDERVTLSSAEQLAGWEDEPSVVSTSQADALEMVGPLVDKALREGRTSDADSMLHAHLMNVVESLRHRRYVRDETVRRAARYALQLADATRRGRWIDYALEVLTIVRMPLDDATSKALQGAAMRVDRVDSARVRAYVEAMKSGERGTRELWSVHQAEHLLKSLTPSKSP